MNYRSKLFYLVMVFLQLPLYLSMLNRNLDTYVPSFPISSYIPKEYFLIWVGLCFTLTLVSLIKFWHKESSWCRLALAFSAVHIYLLSNSFGKENHLFNGLTACSVILACSNLYRDKNNQVQIWRFCQIYFLSIYANAGLWKLKALLANPNFEDFPQAIMSKIAYSIGQGDGPHYLLGDITQWTQFLVWGYFFIILFQISTVIPLIFHRLIPIWGVFAIFFHISTGLTMNIWFFPQMVAVFLIFIIFELKIFRNQS